MNLRTANRRRRRVTRAKAGHWSIYSVTYVADPVDAIRDAIRRCWGVPRRLLP